MEEFFIIIGSIVIYGVGIGISWSILENLKRSSEDEDAVILLSLFLWFFVIPWFVGRKFVRFLSSIPYRFANKKERMRITKKNIKINTIEEYEILRQLCDEFESKFEAIREVDRIVKGSKDV